jgi:hypothetical protein
VEAKVELARKIWDSKVAGLRGAMKLGELEAKMGIARAPPAPFEVLLRLHTHDGAALALLEECYEHDPAGCAGLVPQLLTFLLYGAFLDKEPELERFVLDKCGRSVHFAHRVFWFLRAWQHQEGACSEENERAKEPGRRGSVLQPDELATLGRLLKNVVRRGEGPASLLQVGQGPGEEAKQYGFGAKGGAAEPPSHK